MTTNVDYSKMFERATGNKPYDYQTRLATTERLSELIDVPTGLGKTAAVILAWLWRRRFAEPAIGKHTPCRLAYCLPMRTLVEQTRENAIRWLDRLGMLAGSAQWTGDNEKTLVAYIPEAGSAEGVAKWANVNGDDDCRIAVHFLMGGDDGSDWDEYPERDAILIGTQDMLLSRALNRGYGMSRYRWPMHFGLLNNDCLWVMDETQLMGVGFTTTVQLQGLRSKMSTYGVTRSIWMSATLDRERLATVDHPLPVSNDAITSLSDADRDESRVRRLLESKKSIRRCAVELTPENEKKGYADQVAAAIVAEHQPGAITLAVLNRVQRAQDVYRSIRKQYKKSAEIPEICLIHSRLRPCDRNVLQARALDALTVPGSGRIIVSTQAIEAGVDISARILFTELAPWGSIVQRLGRCNRRGEYGVSGEPDAGFFWIDVNYADAKNADSFTAPYAADDLKTARTHLVGLVDGGPRSLENVEHEEAPAVVHTLRRKDVLDLFDTTPDLAGSDIDVSRFIRDSDDSDVQFYWRALADVDPSEPLPAAHRDELCSVAVFRAREFLAKHKKGLQRALIWRPLEGEWRRVDADDLHPGMVILLAPEMGGYDDALGWTGDVSDRPTPSLPPISQPSDKAMCQDELSDSSRWVPLTEHLADVVGAARSLQESMDGRDSEIAWPAVVTAARWHDVGKAHPAFQNMLLKNCADDDLRRSNLWAKSGTKQQGRPTYWVDGPEGRQVRVGFRHELASALAWLKDHSSGRDSDLVAYLIAAHHGKVRASIRSLPNEARPVVEHGRFARGIWDGDELPPVVLDNGETVATMKLDLGVMELGEGTLGPSWLSRIVSLREHFGPFRLGFLETLLRVADWRGSALGEDRHDS